MDYIAHYREQDQVAQTVKEHLDGTAKLAERFAAPFQSSELAGLCARIHDMGKYSEAFQKRIRGGKLRPDHSTAGAQALFRQNPKIGKLLAYCVAGHHGGLPDGGDQTDTEADTTLAGRLLRKLEPHDAFFAENDLPAIPTQPFALQPASRKSIGFTLSFYIRMLYSCLVDADFLDTERFQSNGTIDREIPSDLELLSHRLDQKLETFGHSDRPIDQKRCAILRDCIDASVHPRGLFSLTVPTGGGKTLSSLAFALRHALKNGLDRIIYVIPYTSIIEQNGAVFSELLGAESVLQHHSNFDFSADDEHGILKKQKLASENWDMPLIVTTNVQFFESLFSNRPSRCRKLHNIANSVILFDEAQMLPTEYLRPCTQAISELVRNYRCTAVLCSATQPALGRFFPPSAIQEICKDTDGLYRFFQRTRMVLRGELSNDALCEELQRLSQVLCIVNTRSHARALYHAVGGSDSFHLSTLMCPIHRKAVIDEIRRRLRAGTDCRVFSTQLIEAGVDVDFPVVYRAMAGIDSLVQSAGRCNREYRHSVGDVFVFEPEPAYQPRSHSLRRPAELARNILQKHPDPLSLKTIHTYFTRLYEVSGDDSLDIKDICRKLEASVTAYSFPFSEIARSFELIGQATRPVVIPFDQRAEQLIAKLRSGPPQRDLIRAMQPYTVSVYEPEYRALQADGKLEQPCDGLSILADLEGYHPQTGLILSEGSGGQGIFF